MLSSNHDRFLPDISNQWSIEVMTDHHWIAERANQDRIGGDLEVDPTLIRACWLFVQGWSA